MWKQDLKKIAMVAVGVGGAYALYNSKQLGRQPIQFESFLHLNEHIQNFDHFARVVEEAEGGEGQHEGEGEGG